MRDAPTSTATVQPADAIDQAQRIAELEDALEQLQVQFDYEAADLRATIAAKQVTITDLRRQLTNMQIEWRRLSGQLATMDADNAKLITANRVAEQTIEAAERAIKAMQAAGRQRIREAANGTDDASRLTFDAPEAP